jgi:hypothetical protein
MAMNFCTMPTQHDKLGYFFPKLTAQLKFPEIQKHTIICVYLYLNKKDWAGGMAQVVPA